MAGLRNIAVFLFERMGYKSAAEATRHYVCHPEETLKIVSIRI